MQPTKPEMWRSNSPGATGVPVSPDGPLLIAHSPKMRDVLVTLDKIAGTDLNVLIRGESGTGKELIARLLQARSARRQQPFVKINCTTLPEDLLESELFGYEKGAFTGATQHKPGKFDLAHGGSIFLDEIGDIRPALQAKLLQVLQGGTFCRLGGIAEVQVDVRIIAATNRNLEAAMQQGMFRRDLFYRLNVFCLQLPALRQRPEDVPLLIDYFLARYSQQYNKGPAPLDGDTMALFQQYPWPGNVRELENMIKRVVILDDVEPVVDVLRRKMQRTAHMEELAGAPTPGPRALREITKLSTLKVERDLISKVLADTHWNRKAAAKILGISYRTLLHKIKAHKLDQQ